MNGPFLALAVLAGSIPAQSVSAGVPEVRLSCVTESPTTSFLITTEGENVTVQIIHHNGTKYAPFAFGPITGFDLPTLNEQAVLVSRLGEKPVFHFKLAACHRRDSGKGPLFTCTPGEPSRAGGNEVTPTLISASRRVEENAQGTLEKLKVQLQLIIDGKSVDLGMEYDPTDCVTSGSGL